MLNEKIDENLLFLLVRHMWQYDDARYLSTTSQAG